MAVVREKGSMRGLCDMLGKTVAVDGCFVGYVGDICIEQHERGAVAMQLLVMMTPDTLDNVREYEYIQDVMGENANEESENHL